MKQKLKNKIELFFWPAYLIRYNRKVEEKIADINRLSEQDKSEYPKKLAGKYNNLNDEPMPEYRFYCFDGEPEYIATWKLDDDLVSCEDLYDTEWNKLDAILGCGNPHHTREEKPEELGEMLNLSRKLSEGYKFVRADMNLTPEHIYFGENTFTDGSGMYEIIPKEFDYEMGTKLILPTGK